MQKYRFVVDVQYKNNVRDPRGEMIKRVLNDEYDIPVTSLRLGKSIHLEIEAENEEDAMKLINKACEKLLVNTVTETYEVRRI